jgi:hypothetical protein
VISDNLERSAHELEYSSIKYPSESPNDFHMHTQPTNYDHIDANDDSDSKNSESNTEAIDTKSDTTTDSSDSSTSDSSSSEISTSESSTAVREERNSVQSRSNLSKSKRRVAKKMQDMQPLHIKFSEESESSYSPRSAESAHRSDLTSTCPPVMENSSPKVTFSELRLYNSEGVIPDRMVFEKEWKDQLVLWKTFKQSDNQMMSRVDIDYNILPVVDKPIVGMHIAFKVLIILRILWSCLIYTPQRYQRSKKAKSLVWKSLVAKNMKLQLK